MKSGRSTRVFLSGPHGPYSAAADKDPKGRASSDPLELVRPFLFAKRKVGAMRIEPKGRSRCLKLLELAIGCCYLFLGFDHPIYIFIGTAHCVSVLLHLGGAE